MGVLTLIDFETVANFSEWCSYVTVNFVVMDTNKAMWSSDQFFWNESGYHMCRDSV